MRESRHLELALDEGLQLTDHKVELKLSQDHEDWSAFVADTMPLLSRRLTSIGKPWESLDETTRKILLRGIGAISALVPMLCFTEVPEGRNISNHQVGFGAYGLVVRRQWLDEHGADRVIYVGQNSSLSRRLFRVLADFRIASLFAKEDGQVIFDSSCFADLLDLLVHVQVREHLEEFEWRIAGNHGLMGGVKDTGKRLPIRLQDIEYVLVQNQEDIAIFQHHINTIVARESHSSVPKVLHQPDVIPA